MRKWEAQACSDSIASGELQDYSRFFVDSLLKKAICCQPLLSDVVDFAFYSSEKAYQAEPKRCIAGPIFSEKKDNGCRLHICEECLKGIPSLALRGWLEQEVVFCRQNNREELYCNFRQNILPLFPVVGSAENFIRELVHHIESGLRRCIATEKIVELGLGLHQVYLYFFRFNPGEQIRERYETAIPHNWIRAHFLGKKLIEIMPISLLAYKNIGFSRNLKALWWEFHDFLIPGDKLLLKEIAELHFPHQDTAYCDILIKIFKKFKSNLLEPRATGLRSIALH